MSKKAILLDSVTDASRCDSIVITGSHGGLYPAAVASNWQMRAVVFNDAGMGLENAGVAGVMALENIGMAVAASDSQSCCIGSAADTLKRGLIKIANSIALDLGVSPGMPVADALTHLMNAPKPSGKLPMIDEARKQTTLPGLDSPIWLLDSASLICPEDEGEIVITGSHGGLVGGDPLRALKTRARIAVFNDAGVGIDQAGITRLPILNKTGVAAVTVDCQTARIGDAESALETGLISHANKVAENIGARKNANLKSWLKTFQV